MRTAEPGPGGGRGTALRHGGGDAAALRAYLVSFLLAAVIGVIGGLTALAFQRLADVVRVVLMGGDLDEGLLAAAKRLVWWQRLLLPALGATAAAVLVHVVLRRALSAPAPDVLESVSLRKGGMNLPAVLSRSLATAFVIGSGGSVGREGPIVQMSGAFASSVGRVLRRSPRDVAVLVACGAAAGLAGAYNAPVGASMFVMEVVLGSFVMEQFAPVIVSSVTSVLTVRAVAGTASVYHVPALPTAAPWEALPIFALGLLSALVGWGFVRFLSASEDRFRASRLPRWAQPTLGGLLVGALGIGLPEVWGNGYDAVGRILAGAFPLSVLAILLPAKAIATGITTGSGASGGVFTPTLFLGAALGGTFGSVLATLLPHAGVEPGLFALLGMGSVLAATTHAPLMAILLLFEMTLDANLIAPLMLAAITATVFARWIHADSLYTEELRRRGVRVPAGVEEAALLRTYARDLVRTDAAALPAQAPLTRVLDEFLSARRDALYVVGDGGRYVGVARIHDVKAVFGTQPDPDTIIAMDVAIPAPAVAEDEAIGTLLARFDDPELDEVPVVASRDDPRFVGVLTRRDILAMLRHEVIEERVTTVRVARRGGTDSAYLELPQGWHLSEVAPPPEALGLPVDATRWHAARGEVPLVVVRSDGAGARRALAPAETPLREGDLVVVLGSSAPPRAP